MHKCRSPPGCSSGAERRQTRLKQTFDALVVGAGYATGYPRGASGRIHVLVNGRRAPQVGRICMGMFMIDVTGLSARAGDLAWLLGGPAAPGETPVSIDELAEACGGFSYELLCLLGQGSPRVYHK